MPLVRDHQSKKLEIHTIHLNRTRNFKNIFFELDSFEIFFQSSSVWLDSRKQPVYLWMLPK